MPQRTTASRHVPPSRRPLRIDDGYVTINFGSSHVYRLRSCLRPHDPPTTIYITDLPDQLDPEFHPIHGTRGGQRVYHGWFYKQEGKYISEGNIAVKWVTRMSRIRKLEKERENYCLLGELQGQVIPELYDYLEATVEGVDVGCLLLQWCGAPLSDDSKLLSAQKLQAATRLHVAGWQHGSLDGRSNHHFVAVDGDNVTDNPLRIIDLSDANYLHPCPFNPSQPNCKEVCNELDILAAMCLINMK